MNTLTGECSIRVNSKSITFCEKYSDISDECLECVYGYSTTNDNLRCLKQLAFCQEYEASNSQTERFKCYICTDGYYLNETTGECIQPADYFSSRCQRYKRNSSQCEECTKNTYVKSVTLCQPHDQDIVTPYCVTTSLIDRNTCDVCEEGFLLFPAESNCIPLTTVIENCKTYADEENCAECLVGYFGSKCERIDPSLHCLVLDDSGKCTECERDYYLDTQTQYQLACYRPPAIFEDYCDEIVLEYQVFTCSQCKENMLSMNYIYSNFCDSPDVDVPEFCVKLGKRGGGSDLECVKCEPGYYLKDKACVRQCNFDNYVIQMQSLEFKMIAYFGETRLINYGEQSCVQSIGDLCLVKTYSATNTSKALQEVCARCKENASPVITDATYSFSHLLNVEFSISADNHAMIRAPAVECVDNQTLFGAIHDGTAKEFCKYFKENDTEYVCQRCINGHSGPLKHVATLASGITDCSSPIPYCNSDVSFKGANYKAELTITLESMYSCSACEGDRIPFIHVERKSPGNFAHRSYDFAIEGDYIFSESVDPTSNAVVCRNPNDPSDLGLAAPNTSFVRPCGLGIINVLASRQSDEYLKCLSCPPGFAATYDSTEKDYITACEKIENCDTSYGFQWFNACSKCTGGFLYEFNDTNNVVNYDKCIQKDARLHKNCVAGVDQGKCYVCESGYTLNEDQVCELISAFDCLSNFTNNDYQEGSFGVGNNQYDFTLPLVYNFDGKGCSKCTSNSRVAIELGAFPQFYCTPRSYIAFNTFADGSPFVDDCLKYEGGTNSFSCIECRDGSIISGTKGMFSSTITLSGCIPFNSNLNFCKIANKSNQNQCLECMDNYYLMLDNTCASGSVNNCIETKVVLFYILCDKCAEGYFKNAASQCVKGNVENCKTYVLNENTCAVCEEGYQMFKDSSNKYYCIKMQDSKCKKWVAAQATDSKYDCEVCHDGFTPSKDKSRANYRPNYCFGPVVVDNCIEYGIDQKSVSNSRFQCVKCKEGFYQSAGACVKRENLNVNCKEYDQIADECSECFTEYVISDDSQECLDNPTGVDFCSGYEDLSTCKFCDKDYFLSDNKCVAVATEKVQAACLQYKSETQCEICATANYLDADKVCRSSDALHCKEYKNSDECTSCLDGYFLKTINNPKVDDRPTIQVCEQEQTVANCLIQTKRLNVENNYDYFCLQCVENFYLGENGCVQVTSLITDCMYYSSNSECLYCIAGKVTSEDKKQCINSYYVIEHGNDVDANCKQNRISKAPVCNFCKPGFIHINNECVKCETEEDCFTCDPNDLTRCLICKPGHYMNADRKCLENEKEEGEDGHDHHHDHGSEGGEQADTGGHDHGSEHVDVWRVLVSNVCVLAALVLLVK